ncbi:hypothetical protein Ssi03_14340 [Sphaerisporangium siamense]|nr:hypothetical protein Ssi03_14340 [Sphaerisporangium siamense]
MVARTSAQSRDSHALAPRRVERPASALRRALALTSRHRDTRPEEADDLVGAPVDVMAPQGIGNALPPRHHLVNDLRRGAYPMRRLHIRRGRRNAQYYPPLTPDNPPDLR